MRKTTRTFTSQSTGDRAGFARLRPPPTIQPLPSPPILPESFLGPVTKGALLVGAFIFAGIASLAVIPLPAMLVFKVAVLAGAIASASQGVYWLTRIIHNTISAATLTHGTQETSPDDASPTFQETTTPTGDPAPLRGERLDRIARIILERHFLDGLGVTRDDCEQAGVANQAEWNLINQVFRTTGIAANA